MRKIFRYLGLGGSGSWRNRVQLVAGVGTQPEGSSLTCLPTGGDCTRDSFLFSHLLYKGELNELVEHCIVVKGTWAVSVCTLVSINVLRISSSHVYHIVMSILATSDSLRTFLTIHSFDSFFVTVI